MPYKPLGINLNREYRNDLNGMLKELYDRISNIVAQAGSDNTEIVDARLGVDGQARPTLGDFIRELQQQIIDLQEGGNSKLVSYQYVLTATVDGQTDFDIPLESFTLEDTILIIQNRSVLGKDIRAEVNKDDYIIDDFNADGIYTIRLNEGVSIDTDLFILILKNVPQGKENGIHANILQNGTLSRSKIDSNFENDIATLETNLSNLQNEITDHLADFVYNSTAKNSIYRGKFLGNSVTNEQYQAISSGTFEDLYIGDYWTIGGVNYRIAGFDYYYNTGDIACTTHHAVIVPDTPLYSHVMNDTNTTTGGYVGSKMYTEGLTQAKTMIESAFSGHVLNHRQILSNATDANGKASGWAWYDSQVELMSEIMLYGSSVFGASSISGGSGYNIGLGKSQLPLFALNPRMINTRQSYWLRDVVSGSYFAYASYNGNANYNNASSVFGVRPAFSIS